MYPESLFWWIGGTAILIGILGIIGMLVWWLDTAFQRHIEKKHGAPHENEDDEGRSKLWYVFEVLSAILVVTSLLVAIYSNSMILRGVAGLALIVLVSAATTAVLTKDE